MESGITMNVDNGQHTSEEQLILHHYGEEADPAAAAAVDLHLEQCAVCRAEYAGLRGVLAAVNEEPVPVPDRGEFYGQETWNRVRGSIGGGGVARLQQQRQQHISEEEMTLHYYDEAEGLTGSGTVTDHLRQCAECRNRFAEIRQMLASIDAAAIRVPERSETYGREVWKRVQGRLAETASPPRQPEAANTAKVVTMPVSLTPRRSNNNWRTWAAIAAMLVVGVSGYIAGRWSAADGSKKNGRGVTVAGAVEGADAQFEAGRKRVLMVALTDHFERSQMVLAELSNADPGEAGKLDIRYERDEASELLDSNRLYRQAAQQQGDTQAAVLLEDLERMLLEVAHTPDHVGSGEFQDLQKRIQDQGLVFKVKVLTSRLERQNNKLCFRRRRQRQL